MKPETIYTVVFSPTGTSKKIAAAVARGIASATGTAASVPLKTIDLTHSAGQPATLPADTVTVIAAPVYGGRVAPTAVKRFETLRGEGTPAVVIAVYGNRAFEKAVAELAGLASRQGFVPVAAGAFVGEHSYSTPETPVAAGRPDAQDLAEAEAFGAAVREKLAAGNLTPVDAAGLKDVRTPLLPMLRFIRFVLGYRRRQRKNPVVYLQAMPTSAPVAAAVRRSAPRRPSPAATKRTPIRRAASAAAPASRDARSGRGVSTPPSPQPSHATSPGANRP